MAKISLPIPLGEYAVGTMTFTVCKDREETMYCDPGGVRNVPARVYYPAEKKSCAGLPKARYMSQAMVTAIRNTFFLPLSYQKMEKDGRNRSECYPGAPFISGKRFPLVFFNHGYISFREGNSFLCTDLASRGYVVISVGHPYEAMLTEYDDGTASAAAPKITSRMYSPRGKGLSALNKLTKAEGTNEQLAAQFDAMQREYCPFMMGRIPEWEKDTLAALRYAKENLADIIDFECGIGVTGHSFGGATAFALCEDRDEFTCGINIDGGLWGDHEGKIMRKPFLQLNCEKDKNACARGFIRHTAPAFHAVVKNMKHMGFSDMKHMINMKSQMGSLDPDTAHETVCNIHAEFFDAFLKGIKDSPDLKSNNVMTFKEYAPDING